MLLSKENSNFVRYFVMMRTLRYILLVVVTALLCGFASCRRTYVPRPYGYYRIEIPDTTYQLYDNPALPYLFEVSTNARVEPRTKPTERYWIDIRYPDFDVRIHGSYLPVNGNLRELGDDAQNFVYKHAGKASAIPEQGYDNADERVYGVFYELQGNTASPYQFYLTDSLHHFFRGAVYVNCVPNQDSLQPVIDYLQYDVRHLMESFRFR